MQAHSGTEHKNIQWPLPSWNLRCEGRDGHCTSECKVSAVMKAVQGCKGSYENIPGEPRLGEDGPCSHF